MKNISKLLLALMATSFTLAPVKADSQTSVPPAAKVAASAGAGAEAGANSNKFPRQILRTGINLNARSISANSIQLAQDIQLVPILERIQSLSSKISELGASPERIDARLDLLEAKQQAMQLINKTNLEIDFTMAEMSAEQNVYSEILSSFTGDRDKLLAKVNAISFISNGALWALAEGFDIPTHTKAFYANPSGINGILAGVIPSFASLYTLKAINGKKKTSEVEPNMLAKLFNYPTTADIEYPASVWSYLNEVPADEPKGKTRKEQMIDRWVADSNIPGFTSRSAKGQLDVITASVAQKKGLNISTLGTRQVMLTQLSSEVMKMKRMLLELAMVVQGDKQFVAMAPVNRTTKKLGSPARAIASQTAVPSHADHLDRNLLSGGCDLEMLGAGKE
jgi:hypothetical protein